MPLGLTGLDGFLCPNRFGSDCKMRYNMLATTSATTIEPPIGQPESQFMISTKSTVTAVYAALLLLGAAACSRAATPDVPPSAKLLPESTVAFAWVDSPSQLVDLVLHHPLRERVESWPAYQQVMEADGLVKFKSGLSIFEAGMGMRWPKFLKQLTEGGLSVALDGESEGMVALVCARPENRAGENQNQAGEHELLGRLRATVFSLVRGGKPAGAETDPIATEDYSGQTVYSINGDTHWVTLDNWMVLTNKIDLARQVIDRFREEQAACLADEPSFLNAVRQRPADGQAWGYLNVQAVRESGQAQPLMSGRTENVVAEALLGGIVSNLQHTPYATFDLQVDSRGIEARLQTPHQNDWVGEDRAYYFGDGGHGTAPRLLQPERTLFALSTYRDLSQMWLRGGDLMIDKAVDELEQADTQLTTFFSGRDFGDDILSGLGPEIQFVAAQQDFADVLPRPAIKLPAFAFRTRMLTPRETQAEFRRVFQSLIGFINVVGAMQGQPQFDLDQQPLAGGQLIAATYVAAPAQRDSTSAAINYNFSPTVAFTDEHFVLSSTTDLARELATGASSSDIVKSTLQQLDNEEPANSMAHLNGSLLQAVLKDNHDQLIAQNMLENGHSREEAEGEIGLLMDLLGLIRDADLRLDADASRLRLTFRAAVTEMNAPQESAE